MCHWTSEAHLQADLAIFTPGLDLGRVEDLIDTLLQGPRFDPGNHLNGIRRLTFRCTNSN
jgi:hypothetical protein